MSRPRIAPGMLAELTQGLPGRLLKKLDAEPRLAEGYAWLVEEHQVVVTTPGGEQVTLSPAQGLLEQATCSCLLAPRCLHLVAVASILELAEPVETAPAEEEFSEPPVELDPEQVRCAGQAFTCGARVLEAGAQAAGAVLQAEVLRAVHECRALGLHRLASAGLRLVQDVRDLRGGKPEFRLEQLTGNLHEFLETAWVLSQGRADPARVGTARRSYQPVGSLRLHGLFCEAVASGAGYAGVVTYVSDPGAAIYSVADVQPGPPERACQAYQAGVSLGGLSLSHQELSRSGVFLSGATASADGRLGGGQKVQASRAEGCAWSETGHFKPWPEQWERAGQALQLPPAQRPAGSDLLFMRGSLVGWHALGLVLALDEGATVQLLAPSLHDQLAYRANLRLLARFPGLSLACVGRRRKHPPDSLEVLAVELGGERFNLGLDRLSRGQLPEAEGPMPELEWAYPDPLEALRRRLQRAALGGRLTLDTAVHPVLEAEAARLERRLMPTGARLLRGLAGRAVQFNRSITGERRAPDPEPLARAWLASTAYLANSSLSQSPRP